MKIVALFFTLFCSQANAQLGEVLGSSPSPTLQKTSVSAAMRAGISNTVYRETRLNSGTVVHEYLNSQNRVYAVTWTGPTKPPLMELLGKYSERLTTASQKGGGTSQLHIVQDDFEVHSTGHMRSFQGYAYLPALLPAGMTVQALQ